MKEEIEQRRKDAAEKKKQMIEESGDGDKKPFTLGVTPKGKVRPYRLKLQMISLQELRKICCRLTKAIAYRYCVHIDVQCLPIKQYNATP